METYAQGDSNENAADCRSDTPSAIQSEIIYLDLWVSKAGAFLWLLSLLGSQRAEQSSAESGGSFLKTTRQKLKPLWLMR